MNNPHVDTGHHVGSCKVKHLTEKALLVELPDNGGEKWVPKSQLHGDSELDSVAIVGEEGELVITDWLKKKWDAE